MKVVEVKHPLVKHKIGLMREGDISTKRFFVTVDTHNADTCTWDVLKNAVHHA